MAHSKQPATSGPSASSGPGAQANSQTALQRVKGHCNDLLLRGALKIPNCFIIPQPPPPREREKASQVSPVRTQAAVPHGPTQALISPGSAREQDPGAGSVSQPGGSRHSGLSSQLEQVLTAPAIPALYTQKPHTVCVRKVATLQGQPRGSIMVALAPALGTEASSAGCWRGTWLGPALSGPRKRQVQGKAPQRGTPGSLRDRHASTPEPAPSLHGHLTAKTMDREGQVASESRCARLSNNYSPKEKPPGKCDYSS